MMTPAVRAQLAVSTLLFAAAGLFGTAALQMAELADGWTTRGIGISVLGLFALVAAVGPWLWAQTVHGQRLLPGAILLGSGGGLIVLLPAVSYDAAVAAQAPFWLRSSPSAGGPESHGPRDTRTQGRRGLSPLVVDDLRHGGAQLFDKTDRIGTNSDGGAMQHENPSQGEQDGQRLIGAVMSGMSQE